MFEHTNKQFHADIETARSLFLEMGGLVESMLNNGMEVLSTGDQEVYDQVIELEKRVNKLEIELDERIILLIARNQPTAIDLRLLLSISKMLTDMERCGDEAEKITKMAMRFHEGGQGFSNVVELRHMAELVGKMIRDALDAFARQDAISAAAVVAADVEVNKEWQASLRHISTFMIEDPRTISRSIDLIFIARALERIGDHAKNMAERIIFMVRGADVRHQDLEDAQRLARGE